MTDAPQTVDILAVGIHPDDVEISCAGTLVKMKNLGYSFGILDLSEGEMGTRGNSELRKKEAMESAVILGATFRTILNLPDAKFEIDSTSIEKVMSILRVCRPRVVLCNAPSDRHPDHGRAAELVRQASFYSGLPKWKTFLHGNEQDAFRPQAIYHYIQDYFLKPDFVVDITRELPVKLKAMESFRSQFYNPNSMEPETPISRKDFMDYVVAKMRMAGRYIHTEFAEGFLSSRPLGVNNIVTEIY